MIWQMLSHVSDVLGIAGFIFSIAKAIKKSACATKRPK